MSSANKCDRCGVFFEPEPGTMVVDVAITDKSGDKLDNWSDIDLCKPCGDKVLEVIAPALNGLER